MFSTVITSGNLFPTVITSGNVFSTVITSRNVFPTVTTRGNLFPAVITSGNVFPTVKTSGNNCAWADATTCFIETLIRRSRRKQNIVNSTWTWRDVVYLAVLCVLIFSVNVPVLFEKHFNSYAVSTSGYVFHGSLMIPNKLTQIHDVCSHNLTVQDQHRRYNALKNYFTAGFLMKKYAIFFFAFIE